MENMKPNIRAYYNAVMLNPNPSIRAINGALYVIAGGKSALPRTLNTTYFEIARRYLLTGNFFSKVKFNDKGAVATSVAKLAEVISIVFRVDKKDMLYKIDGFSIELRVGTVGFRFTKGDEKTSVRAFYVGFINPLFMQSGLTSGLDDSIIKNIMELSASTKDALNMHDKIIYRN